MELSDIIRNATAGCLAGLVLGVSGTCDKHTEKIEFCESNLTKEEREKSGLTEEAVKKFRQYERREKLLLPYIVGGIYSLIQGIMTDDAITEGMVAAIPSAYVGRAIGGTVRRLIRKNHKKDLQIARKIRDDPEHALSYIPKEKKEIIESSLSEIERKILNGEQLNEEELKAESGPLKRIYDSINVDNKSYSPVLMKWSIGKFDDICQTATVQREISSFYKNQNPVSVAILGSPENTSLLIYEVDGTNLKIYSGIFDKFRSVEHENVGMAIECSSPRIELKEARNWTEDYKDLAKEIIISRPSHTTILINTLPDMPESVRAMMVTNAFATAFATYKKFKSGEENSKRKHYGFDGDPSLN